MSITYFACVECVPGGFWVVVFRSALGLAPFFPSSLLGFQALKYLSDVPAKFITICGGKCAQNMGQAGTLQSMETSNLLI